MLKLVSIFLKPYGIIFDYENYEFREVNNDNNLFLQKFVVSIQLSLGTCVYPFIIMMHYILCCLCDFEEYSNLDKLKDFIKKKIMQSESILLILFYYFANRLSQFEIL